MVGCFVSDYELCRYLWLQDGSGSSMHAWMIYIHTYSPGEENS